jgi:hypothetical protein
MPFSFVCPACKTKSAAPDDAAGKKVKCPKCGTVLAIPPPASAPDFGKPQPQAEAPTLPEAGTGIARNVLNRISKLSNACRTGLLISICVLVSNFCCFGTTWYAASSVATRRERERIGDELKEGLGQLNFAQEDIAKTQVSGPLTQACQAYFIRHKEYPQNLQLLTQRDPANGNAPYLDNADALLDPWAHPYQYDPSGQKNNNTKPDIWTVVQKSNPQKMIGNWPRAARQKP